MKTIHHGEISKSSPLIVSVRQSMKLYVNDFHNRFMVIPDMLKNAPMFKRLEARIKVCIACFYFISVLDPERFSHLCVLVIKGQGVRSWCWTWPCCRNASQGKICHHLVIHILSVDILCTCSYLYFFITISVSMGSNISFYIMFFHEFDDSID